MQNHSPPASIPPASPKRCIFIFDNMRLRSHLFFRYLSTNSQLYPIYHPFLMAGILGEERWAKRAECCEIRKKEIWEGMQRFVTADTYESLKDTLIARVEEGEKKGTIPLVNEHAVNSLREDILYGLHRNTLTMEEAGSTNPTHIPDSIFSSLTPVILIRHPILQTDSSYRILTMYGFKNEPTDEDFQIHQSTKSARFLFDMFTAQGRQPIVVDGEDVVYRTEALTKALCEKLGMGLEPNKFREVWEKTPEEEIPQHPLVRGFTNTLHSSTGIERPRDGTPDAPNLERMVEKWTEMFGPDTAIDLKKVVESNMADYEYLAKFKI